MNLSRQNNSLTKLVVTTLCVGLLFAYDYWSAGAVRSLARTLYTPVFSITHATTGFFTHVFTSMTTSESEVDALRARVHELEPLAAAYTALSEKHERLEQEFLHKTTTSYGAEIISLPTESPYGTFLIRQHTEGLFSVGDIVSFKGIAIGSIVQLTPRHAQVQSMLSPDTVLTAVAHGVQVTLHGSGGNNGEADAPRGTELRVGDIVTAPSLNSRPIGVVASVEDDPSLPHVHIVVRPALNLNLLQYVTVEKI